MTKKFTEQQYEEIVKTQKDYFPYNLLGLGTNGKYFIDSLSEEILSFAVNHDLVNKMLAIANPLTREWAHDKFVEKEKKYYWKSKKTDKNGLFKTIIEHTIGYPEDSYYINAKPGAFTESEIREWGYNPDMFDREEV